MTAPSNLLEECPSTSRPRVPRPAKSPRVWGKSVFEIWCAYLSTFRIQVVTPGSSERFDPDAELFLLVDSQHVAHFDVGRAVDQFRRQATELGWLRLTDPHVDGYRERCVTDDEGRLVRVERIYESPRARRYRLALTRSVKQAAQWRLSRDAGEACGPLINSDKRKRSILRIPGTAYDLALPEEVTRFMVRLIKQWKNPSRSIAGVDETRPGVWSFDAHAIPKGARVVGQVWVGFDRSVDESDCLVGPAVLWDRRPEETARAVIASSLTRPVEPPILTRPKAKLAARSSKRGYAIAKRTFDICFALTALALTLPFYPIVMLLIYLEDGWPIFFGHRRETVGGKAFDCLKFRSMRKDAEEVRRRILAQNMCDGPQFFIDRDPRLTRIGRIIRDLQIDEWPQFWHVLSGKMSVVGPRPLPEPENQYCPAWREARLSVRPGITGLWQLKRSRLPGLDFQEWIRYDIEYVENCSMALDLWIIWESIRMMFRLGWSTLTGRRAPKDSAPVPQAASSVATG